MDSLPYLETLDYFSFKHNSLPSTDICKKKKKKKKRKKKKGEKNTKRNVITLWGPNF